MTKNTPFIQILDIFAPLNDVHTYIAWSWKTTPNYMNFFYEDDIQLQIYVPPPPAAYSTYDAWIFVKNTYGVIVLQQWFSWLQKETYMFCFLIIPALDGTPPNPSTIDVMVGRPSKKQMRARDMSQSLGNLFLVRLVIYYEFERV